MPKGPGSFFWAAIGTGELSAFFAAMSWSVQSHEGLFVSLAFVGASTIAAIVNQMIDV